MINKVISYPQMGNYSVVVYYLLKKILHCKVMKPEKITAKTIELGSKYSPDFVCMPFKYTLGTFIESLEKGANVLIQAGGGCRNGYYSELQEQILRDLGYNFTYINLVSKGKSNKYEIYKKIKSIDSKLNFFKVLYYLFIAIKMTKYMDIIDNYIRKNIGFEVEKGSFNKLYNEMLANYGNSKCYLHLYRTYLKYYSKFKSVIIKKPDNCLKIGIIGELYTIMEPFSNYNLENILALYKVEITRFTNATYLLFQKKKMVKKYLKETQKYIKYKMGADAHDNIGRTKYLCENNYDGIIHIKSSFCTPEIGAMPIIDKICKEYFTPIVYFSFDSNTSEVGIKTRIEAFIDMLNVRKK
ncbi:MAG: 2-hydroxyacyl-CoA dehydratase [Bacilli bacterium]